LSGPPLYVDSSVVVVLSAFGTRPTRAQGVDGFAFCTTLGPTSSFYVAGDPVYSSEISEVKVDSPDYQKAFKDFLKTKYGWTKTVSCSVPRTREGATKDFNERLKAKGGKRF
jgi:hypothetical protein